MTNLEKIKSMSVEEMAYFLLNLKISTFCPSRDYFDKCEYTCDECVVAWLNEEVRD